MPFFDEITGTLTFDSGLCLTAHMPQNALIKALQSQGGITPDLGAGGLLLFPACAAAGGILAPACTLAENALQAVTLSVVSIGGRTAPTAEQQRTFLFACIRAKDPAPDTRRPCKLRCEFGSASIYTDPRLGTALLRIVYE